MLGILTGLEEEAKLASRAFPEAKIALSHAQESQGKKALQALLRAGATELLSFGCAGGLDSSLLPGTIIVPGQVYCRGKLYSCDEKMVQYFGADKACRGRIFHSPFMIETACEKKRIREKTLCRAVDMESGLVAEAGLPFAVLRVICDDASQNLPPAASAGLKNGKIYFPGLVQSLCCHPTQLPALIKLGKDAAKSRKAMARFLSELL